VSDQPDYEEPELDEQTERLIQEAEEEYANRPPDPEMETLSRAVAQHRLELYRRLRRPTGATAARYDRLRHQVSRLMKLMLMRDSPDYSDKSGFDLLICKDRQLIHKTLDEIDSQWRM